MIEDISVFSTRQHGRVEERETIIKKMTVAEIGEQLVEVDTPALLVVQPYVWGRQRVCESVREGVGRRGMGEVIEREKLC